MRLNVHSLYKIDEIKIREFPELDFLRFIAITSVVIFHFTSRRYDLLPYGYLVEGSPWNLGWVGVNLFFIISGYVVSHTILKSSNARIFMIKRITRIYPTLWLILPVVYLCQKYIPYSIFKERSSLVNLLGSMTLLPPTFLNLPNLIYFDWLTGVLWSLKVEMVFYILCYLLFSFFPYQRIVLLFVLLCILSSTFLIFTANFTVDYVLPIVFILKGLGFEYLPWFILGMLFYQQKVLKHKKIPIIILLSGLILAVRASQNSFSSDQVAELGVIMLFAIVIFRGQNSRFIRLKIFQVLGFSSYEMYIIHWGLGFPVLFFLITKFNLARTESFLLMVVVTVLLFALSLLISKITLRLNTKLRQLLIGSVHYKRQN
jgi:peptidoglycan/LPS O-acetylase OafA/YrhL